MITELIGHVKEFWTECVGVFGSSAMVVLAIIIIVCAHYSAKNKDNK